MLAGFQKHNKREEFSRHVDECKYSKFEKDFCLFCRRDCVKQVVDY
jgi:hypothetical protein